MKRLVFILVACLFLFSSCARDKSTPGTEGKTSQETATQSSSTVPSKPEYKASDFLPLTKDVHIVYKGTGNEFASLERYVDYIKGNTVQFRDINAGTTSVNVYTISGGELKKVHSHGEGYFRWDFTSMNDIDEVIIKEPIKVGTEWTLKDGSKRAITAVDMDLSTPYGSMKALEVTTTYPESIVKEYYAKDIGFVKRVFSPSSSPNDKVVTEIEKLEKNVPFKWHVNYYYPNYENEKIYYIGKIMELYTNEEPYKKIQDELKKAPDNSGLTRVLTPGAQVKGVKVDMQNGKLYLDFSSQLVSEMNAGAGLESMILACIADTFGSYYQSGKVNITVEGKPYSSGHIIIGPGDFLKVNTQNTEEYHK